MEVFAPVLFTFFAAGGALLVARWLPRLLTAYVTLVPLALLGWFAQYLPFTMGGGDLVTAVPWIPSVGVSLAFQIDGLSLLFALLISGIGACVFLYASSYLSHDPQKARFFPAIIAFMGAMLGLVLADDFLTLFVFWELTSITSYLLIGYYSNEAGARRSALQAFLVTGAGGLALLAGLVLLGLVTGTWQFSGLAAHAEMLQAHPLTPAILVLIFLGAFTKSAQYPFHFWLPNAMTGPAPVSAFLHSATMVKGGVYLLAQLQPVFSGDVRWTYPLIIVGAVTMVWTAFLAIRSVDVKKILAYSTVCILGVLTMLIGVGTLLAIKAVVVLILAHAFYKASLFMIGGIIDHETHERDVTKLGGLRKYMPWTAGIAALAALSNAGLPPMLGFVAKEYFYKAKLDLDDFSLPLTLAALAANAFLVVVAGLIALKPFWGSYRETPHHPHDPPWAMRLGPLLLALLGLAFGILQYAIDASLVAPAMATILASPVEIKLALWHGLTPALGLSAATITVGVLLYLVVRHVRRIPLPVDFDRVYEALVQGTLKLAGLVTGLIQNGNLRHYILTALLTLLLGTAYLIITRPFPLNVSAITDVYPHEAAVALLLIGGALMAATTNSRLTAIMGLGAVGIGVTLVFLLFSAPDLAMTQVLVETLTVLLFVICFYRLPTFARLSSVSDRVRDALVAGLAGVAVTLLLLFAIAVDVHDPVSAYHLAESVPSAQGRNIVNVILVDFRALDTLGEVIVIGIAALGIVAMLKLRPARKEGSSS